METHPGFVRGAVLAAVLAGLLAVPEAKARPGHGGGHGGGGHGGGGHGGGGHASRAPRLSMPHGGFTAARMPHVRTPARASTGRTQAHSSHGQHSASTGSSHANHSQNPGSSGQKLATNTSGTATNGAAARAGSTATTGAVKAGTSAGKTTGAVGPAGLAGAAASAPYRATSATSAVTGATQTNPTSAYGNQYTYGYGTGARHYRPYGYGSGYRNGYYGRRYGYGRSQGTNRGIVGRLRSVQMQLARIDHDYQGHRVRAMHSVGMAIRQLSHSSMGSSGGGFASGMNNGRGMGAGMGMGMGAGMGRRGAGGGGGRMPQAQSDTRMSHALRSLQGVNMQLGSQGAATMGQGRARGYIVHAIQELGTALSIR